ncbi:related to Fatty aldehyde dehydrogenase HFD1 [Saccharomycodes ludwigii]|uniref:Aldehyde dehydrogenase n=1 Tax=Saccharomycodes ludwigii TaxID=36035 RepID=A0A376B2N7_9ASCO|nr:related to Fatty aldehyde dehydrogenase HFD1 [Saccharomycodes ludwigii]
MSFYTPLDSISRYIETCNKYHNEHQKRLNLNNENEELQYRLTLLKKLYFAVKDNMEEIILCLYQDFHKSRQEVVSGEIISLLSNILDLIKNLPQWIKNRKVHSDLPLFHNSQVEIQRIPYGTCCIIGPSNFPVLLLLDPLACALAGGNSVILKPSELTPKTTVTITSIIEKTFQDYDGLVKVINGGPLETMEIFNGPLVNKVFYTGSPAVGKIIMKMASEQLIPVTLELGGKSPVFITPSVNLEKLEDIVRRIYFSSFGNAGQICMAADYILCHKDVYIKFIACCKKIYNEMFLNITYKTEYTHMISERAYDKIIKILKRTNAKEIYHLGESNQVELFIPPTLLIDVNWEDSSMEMENFGPILPILQYENLDDCLDNIISKPRRSHPLAEYIFSQDKLEIQYIQNRLKSGGCCINDTLLHVLLDCAPFSGIGSSGFGSYHSEWSYNCFTHERTVLNRPFDADPDNSRFRCPPYSKEKSDFLEHNVLPKEWFSREE